MRGKRSIRGCGYAVSAAARVIRPRRPTDRRSRLHLCVHAGACENDRYRIVDERERLRLRADKTRERSINVTFPARTRIHILF